MIAQAGEVTDRAGRRRRHHHMLKTGLAVQAGEIIDAAVMSRRALVAFVDAQIEDARDRRACCSRCT